MLHRRLYKKLRIIPEITGMLVILALAAGCSFTPVSLSERTKTGDSQNSITYEASLAESSLIQEESTVSTEEPEEETEPEKICISYTLPVSGSGLDDFVLPGWFLLDSVSLDFNEDGIPDYVGILNYNMDNLSDKVSYQIIPRILFAIASSGTDAYVLDFQDINLIRTREEGGVFGDPYQPLTTEGVSFTINAYGGSAWKWSEAHTFTYKQNIWYLTREETSYGYGPYITSESIYDYESGIGIHKKRSDDFESIEAADLAVESKGTYDDIPFDLIYEVTLDEPVTIEQAGKRWWLAGSRRFEYPISYIGIRNGITLKREDIELPEETYTEFNDENYTLYTFADAHGQRLYLARYSEQDKSLVVIAEGTEELPYFDDLMIYDGSIFYSTRVKANVIAEANETKETWPVSEAIAIKLFRTDINGENRREIFEYRLAQPGDVLSEEELPLPYLHFTTEIIGNEVILQVYISGQPQPCYRMDLNGGNVREIGQLP